MEYSNGLRGDVARRSIARSPVEPDPRRADSGSRAAIVDLRADPAIQAMIEDYGERHHEGQLAPDELAQYEAMVKATNLIAVLQAKARTRNS